MKKHQVAVIALLAIAAAITVGCGNSSPTFSKMPFMSDRTVDPSTPLFIMKLDGSTVTPIQLSDTNIWSPTISANLKMVVYVQNSEVWTSNADGTNPVQLTHNSDNNNFSGYARISPNGRKILYQVGVNSEEVYHMFVMNVDGTGSVDLNSSLPEGETGCYTGSFSADSSKVALGCYSSTDSTAFGIFTASADGTHMTPVLTQSAFLDTPTFTPNDKQILFITYGTPGAQSKHAFNASKFRPSSRPSHNQRLHSYGTVTPVDNGVASVNVDGSNAAIIVPNADELDILNSNLYYSINNSDLNLEQISKSNLDGTAPVTLSDGSANDWLGINCDCY